MTPIHYIKKNNEVVPDSRGGIMASVLGSIHHGVISRAIICCSHISLRSKRKDWLDRNCNNVSWWYEMSVRALLLQHASTIKDQLSMLSSTKHTTLSPKHFSNDNHSLTHSIFCVINLKCRIWFANKTINSSHLLHLWLYCCVSSILFLFLEDVLYLCATALRHSSKEKVSLM
jgi:hypothetical protein